MAYSLETSSVKTIVPGAEVSGFCDVVARQKINEVSGEVPQLSAGEGIAVSTVDGKTVITNNISAGSNISLVYDMETNTYRIDSTGGSELPSAISAWSFNNFSQSYSHTPGDLFTETYTGSLFAPSSQWGGGPDSKPKLLLDTTVENYSGTSWVYEHGITSTGHRTTRLEDNMLYINSAIESDTIAGQVYTMVEPDFIRLWGKKPNETTKLIELGSSGVAISTAESATWKQIISAANGGGGGKTYTGVAPIQVNNTTNEISITGESLSAGPGIDMFSSGGYVVVSSTGKELSAGPGIDLFESGGYFVISSNGAGGSTFPITGTNGTTGFTANMDCSSMILTTGASPAGGYVKQTVRGVQYEAYPATDVSASWYNIINGANNRSNCYCIRFTNDMTAASLENYSAYDKVTVVHSNQYTPNCELYWNGNTKVFPSGLYCELVKGTNDQNETDWFFTTSGWINNVEWDYD